MRLGEWTGSTGEGVYEALTEHVGVRTDCNSSITFASHQQLVRAFEDSPGRPTSCSLFLPTAE